MRFIGTNSVQNSTLTSLTIGNLPVYAFYCKVDNITLKVEVVSSSKKLCDILGCRECTLKRNCCAILAQIKRENVETFNEFIKDASIGDVYNGSSVVSNSICGRLFMQEEATIVDINDKSTSCMIFLTDITCLKVANNALEITEEKLDLVLDAFQLGVWDARMCFDSINVSNLAFALVGYQPDQIKLTFRNLIKLIYPDDRGNFIQVLNKAFSESTDEAFVCNLRIRKPDNDYMLYIIRGKVVSRDEKGKPERLFGVIRDVSANMLNLIREDKIESVIYDLVKKRTYELETELEITKKAKEQLLENLRKERELSGMQTVFVNMVSHEFRTPLAVIQMAADLLMQYSNQITEQEKNTHLETIKSSVKRMTQTMEDILILGKCQNAQLKFHPSSVNIVSFCRNILEEVEMFKESKSILFATDHNVPDMLNVDKSLMYHVIVNLLNNALKYSEHDKVVLFKLEYDNNKLKFIVKDQGIGIPKKDIKNMFNIFYRGSNISNRKGLGIGMYIVRHCVKLHGGVIDVASVENEGTTFCITISVKNDNDTAC